MTVVRQRLKHVATLAISNVDKLSVDGQVPVRLCNYTDVYYRDQITNDLDLMKATATPEQVRRFSLRAGDVIITKDSETAEDIGVAAIVADPLESVVCGYHLAIIRPCSRLVDARFLYWSMTSGLARSQLSVAASGVTRYGLRSEAIADLSLCVPSMRMQRAIADFLDVQTARVDAIVERRRAVLEVLDERLSNASTALVLTGRPSGRFEVHPGRFLPEPTNGWATTSLRHVGCEVQTGPFGSQLHAEEYVSGRWPVVNPANLRGGSIAPDWSMTVSDKKRSELAQHVLRRGDIVFGRRGEMGRAGLVTAVQEGWLCGTGSLRLRLRSDLLLPEYLKLLLETSALKDYFSLSSVGSTMDNLNSEIVLGAPVLVPPVSEQREIVRNVGEMRSIRDRAVKAIEVQVQLLQERRQALITAAVTGELDVTRAA